MDVSPQGVRIETSVALRKGQLCELLLRVDNLKMPVAGRVLRAERTGQLTRASVVFERILESDRVFLEQSLVREVAERMTVILR